VFELAAGLGGRNRLEIPITDADVDALYPDIEAVYFDFTRIRSCPARRCGPRRSWPQR